MSIERVAEQAKVSIATVSRVFNTPELVRPATRDRVQAIARSLGYEANASARTLRTQRSRTIGVVLPTLGNPVFAECLEGIAASAQQSGYAILPYNSHYSAEDETAAVHALVARGVDGLIIVAGNASTSQALKRVRSIGLPYVLAYNRKPRHPCVSVDGESAVADVVRRLVALGHRRIGMVAGQLTTSDRAQQRHRGYLQGVRECALPEIPVCEVPFMDKATSEIGFFLAQHSPLLTAVICSNDLLAIRTIRAASLAGLAVPRQLSVVGFDGIELGSDITPSLATIAQPNHDIGMRSAELLFDAIKTGRALSARDSITLDCHFQSRESLATPLQTPQER